MGRMRVSLIILAITVFTLTVLPQDSSPSGLLSGKWRLKDEAGVRIDLEILNSGDQITIIESLEYRNRPFVNRSTLYTDRRGEKNLKWIPGLPVPAEVKSETFWQKNKLVRKSSYSLASIDPQREGLTTVSERDEYSLSKDGQTLVLKSVSTMDSGTRLRHVLLPPSSRLPPRGQTSSLSIFPKKRIFQRIN